MTVFDHRSEYLEGSNKKPQVSHQLFDHPMEGWHLRRWVKKEGFPGGQSFSESDSRSAHQDCRREGLKFESSFFHVSWAGLIHCKDIKGWMQRCHKSHKIQLPPKPINDIFGFRLTGCCLIWALSSQAGGSWPNLDYWGKGVTPVVFETFYCLLAPPLHYFAFSPQ